jgi:hypothetical protein
VIATVAGLTVVAACVAEPGRRVGPLSDSGPNTTDPGADGSSITEEGRDADAGLKAQGEPGDPNTDTEYDWMTPHADDLDTIRKLVAGLKANNKAAVSRLFKYPVAPSVPLPLIRTPEAFIRRYDELFDSKTIPFVLQGCKSPKGIDAHGSLLTTAGPVWVRGGQIFRLDETTDKGLREYRKAKADDAQTLHPTVRNYEAIIVECRTKSHYVRIHSLPNEASWRARYIAWKAGTSPSSAPELSLTGSREPGGSAGNMDYVFKSGTFTYEVLELVDYMCSGGDNCEPRLIVMDGERELSHQVCRRLRSW